MIEASTSRRAVILLASVALLAGCKVIPKGAENIPPPEPVPSDALPKDQARHRVALLVPLTGPNAGMGQSVANATTMALLDTDAKNIRITTYDTAQGAAVAANQAMKDGNKLILGPLATSDVAPVAAVARAAKVPLITYGNDGAVAARDVFVLGSRMENSVERVVSFAASKGITRYAVLAPKGDYGSRVSASYANAVKAAGGSIVASDSYDRGNSSALSAAARLKAKGGYQAVLIADTPRYAAMIAPRLKAAGAANPRILGTDLWSGEALVSTTPALRGAWFAAISDGRFRQFTASYQARFGAAPYRMATLGYDSVLLTVRIAREWRAGTAFPYAKLVDTGGFLGLDGPFRFSANGLVERSLEVRETRSGGITVVSAAPEKFVD
jgi:branched-chain amino acid transport system substrate-binding protein